MPLPGRQAGARGPGPQALTEAVGRPSLTANVAGAIHLLEARHDLGRPIGWQPVAPPSCGVTNCTTSTGRRPRSRTSAPPRPTAFAALYRTWRRDNQVGRWDAWFPYVVAPRCWTLCSIFEPVIRGAAAKSKRRSATTSASDAVRSGADGPRELRLRGRPAPGRVLADADVGLPCPAELPAHAHVDALSVLVQVDGASVLVEAGPFTYAPVIAGTTSDQRRPTTPSRLTVRTQAEV
jgi:hypothetical protein